MMQRRMKSGLMGAAFTLACVCSGTSGAQPADEPANTSSSTPAATHEIPGPAPAEASSPGEANAGSTETLARKHFELGVAAYEAGDFAAAAEAFTKSYELKPHPAILLNVAQSELQAERFVDAATHFRRYLQQVDTPDPAGREGFAQARARVAEVTIEAPPGSMVSVDQAALGQAPLAAPVYLAPGQHELSSNSSAQQIVAEAGATLVVRLDDLHTADELEPPVPEQPARASGRQGFGDWFVDTPVAWVGAGLAVGGFIVSGVAAGTAAARYDAADEARNEILAQFARDGGRSGTPCGPPALNASYERACNVYRDRDDAGDTWKAVSLTTLVVGVAAVGGTIAYYFLDPAAQGEPESTASKSGNERSEKPPVAQLVPVAAPTFQGISVIGTF